VCGGVISQAAWGRSRLALCSLECYREARARAQRLRPTLRECVVCGESFTPGRSDARFCANACRQRAYRLRVKGSGVRERARPIELAEESWLVLDLRQHLRDGRSVSVGDRVRAWLEGPVQEGVVLEVATAALTVRFEDEERIRDVSFSRSVASL
jgi:hypothetical protein